MKKDVWVLSGVVYAESQWAVRAVNFCLLVSPNAVLTSKELPCAVFEEPHPLVHTLLCRNPALILFFSPVTQNVLTLISL